MCTRVTLWPKRWPHRPVYLFYSYKPPVRSPRRREGAECIFGDRVVSSQVQKRDCEHGPLVKCCLMSSDVSWHIRDKLWPMPKHGSINLRSRKPEGSLGRTAQDVHLDSHTAPELWWAVGDVGLHVLGCRVDILGTNCKLRRSGWNRICTASTLWTGAKRMTNKETNL